MEKGTKIKIAVGSAIALGGLTYLVANNARGNSLFNQWETYIAGLKLENNLPGQTGISSGITIYDLAKKYPGAPSKYLKTDGNVAPSTLVVDFYDSFKGATTDTDLFYNTLYKIKNLYTFAFIAKVYEIEYKQKLIDAIRGEALLSGALGNGIFGPVAAVFGQSSRLSAQINNFFANLPEV